MIEEEDTRVIGSTSTAMQDGGRNPDPFTTILLSPIRAFTKYGAMNRRSLEEAKDAAGALDTSMDSGTTEVVDREIVEYGNSTLQTEEPTERMELSQSISGLIGLAALGTVDVDVPESNAAGETPICGEPGGEAPLVLGLPSISFESTSALSSGCESGSDTSLDSSGVNLKERVIPPRPEKRLGEELDSKGKRGRFSPNTPGTVVENDQPTGSSGRPIDLPLTPFVHSKNVSVMLFPGSGKKPQGPWTKVPLSKLSHIEAGTVVTFKYDREGQQQQVTTEVLSVSEDYLLGKGEGGSLQVFHLEKMWDVLKNKEDERSGVNDSL